MHRESLHQLGHKQPEKVRFPESFLRPSDKDKLQRCRGSPKESVFPAIPSVAVMDGHCMRSSWGLRSKVAAVCGGLLSLPLPGL